MEEKIIKKLVDFIISNHYNSNRAQVFKFSHEHKCYEVYSEFSIRWDRVVIHTLSVNRVINNISVEGEIEVDSGKIKTEVQTEITKFFK